MLPELLVTHPQTKFVNLLKKTIVRWNQYAERTNGIQDIYLLPHLRDKAIYAFDMHILFFFCLFTLKSSSNPSSLKYMIAFFRSTSLLCLSYPFPSPQLLSIASRSWWRPPSSVRFSQAPSRHPSLTHSKIYYLTSICKCFIHLKPYESW